MTLLKKFKTKKNFIFCIIPARKNSKGLRDKHLRKVNGKYLIDYTFDVVKKVKEINLTIFCSNDCKLIKLAKKNNIYTPFKRPHKISLDHSSSSEYVFYSLYWFVRKYKFLPNYILILQPTNILRNALDVKRSIKKVRSNIKIDSLVSVTTPYQCPSESVFLNKNGLINEVKIPILNKKLGISNRQSKAKTFFIDGSIYLFSINFFLKNNKFFTRNSYPFLLKKIQGFDINDIDDLNLVNLILKYYKKK